MKIHLLSDLHLEFADYPFEFPQADVLILAGDIYSGVAEDFIQKACDHFPHVIYVTGNHEYYKGRMLIVDTKLQKLNDTIDNFHFLNPGVVEIDGIRFGGGIYWTNFWNNPLYETKAQMWMNDYHYIINKNGKLLTTRDTHAINLEHKAFLLEEKPDVVITHHAPDFQCANKNRHTDRDLDPAYVNDDGEMMINTIQPKLWVYGHTHENFDKELYGTRVLANARGYARWQNPRKGENKAFDPELVIEI